MEIIIKIYLKLMIKRTNFPFKLEVLALIELTSSIPVLNLQELFKNKPIVELVIGN